jgi:hypothetical protein
MRTTVYTSTATRDLTDDDLAELLRQCVRNNDRTGLTGLLLHRDGRFMQVLEGPDEAVQAANTARQFPGWSMGFRTVDDATVRELHGYDDFLDKPASAAARPDAPSRARWLLEWFRTHPA